jgi:hypothetical protein
VYWTISEKRNAKAAEATSDERVLLRFRSYMFGRLGPTLLVETEGKEKRVEVVVGERWSVDDWEEFETTEKRGWG